jgi:hypothetical protein
MAYRSLALAVTTKPTAFTDVTDMSRETVSVILPKGFVTKHPCPTSTANTIAKASMRRPSLNHSSMLAPENSRWPPATYLICGIFAPEKRDT